MKKTALLVAVVFLFALGAFAQSKPDYSGEWTLDVSKSKVNNIESMTVKAAQTADGIKVESEVKRTPNPNGGGQGPGRGMGGPTSFTYTFGKETTVEVDGPGGNKVPVKLKAELADGKLKLSTVRTFTNQNGEAMTLPTNDEWVLSDGGKTLTISRTSTSPRGEMTSTMVFTKK